MGNYFFLSEMMLSMIGCVIVYMYVFVFESVCLDG